MRLMGTMESMQPTCECLEPRMLLSWSVTTDWLSMSDPAVEYPDGSYCSSNHDLQESLCEWLNNDEYSPDNQFPKSLFRFESDGTDPHRAALLLNMRGRSGRIVSATGEELTPAWVFSLRVGINVLVDENGNFRGVDPDHYHWGTVQAVKYGEGSYREVLDEGFDELSITMTMSRFRSGFVFDASIQIVVDLEERRHTHPMDFGTPSDLPGFVFDISIVNELASRQTRELLITDASTRYGGPAEDMSRMRYIHGVSIDERVEVEVLGTPDVVSFETTSGEFWFDVDRNGADGWSVPLPISEWRGNQELLITAANADGGFHQFTLPLRIVDPPFFRGLAGEVDGINGGRGGYIFRDSWFQEDFVFGIGDLLDGQAEFEIAGELRLVGDAYDEIWVPFDSLKDPRVNPGQFRIALESNGEELFAVDQDTFGFTRVSDDSWKVSLTVGKKYAASITRTTSIELDSNLRGALTTTTDYAFSVTGKLFDPKPVIVPIPITGGILSAYGKVGVNGTAAFAIRDIEREVITRDGSYVEERWARKYTLRGRVFGEFGLRDSLAALAERTGGLSKLNLTDKSLLQIAPRIAGDIDLQKIVQREFGESTWNARTTIEPVEIRIDLLVRTLFGVQLEIPLYRNEPFGGRTELPIDPAWSTQIVGSNPTLVHLESLTQSTPGYVVIQPWEGNGWGKRSILADDGRPKLSLDAADFDGRIGVLYSGLPRSLASIDESEILSLLSSPEIYWIAPGATQPSRITNNSWGDLDPSIAMGNGSAVAVWRRVEGGADRWYDRSSIIAREWDGSSWGEEFVIAQAGENSSPVVIPSSGGFGYAVAWIDGIGHDAQIRVRARGFGESWGESLVVLPDTEHQGVESLVVKRDARGAPFLGASLSSPEGHVVELWQLERAWGGREPIVYGQFELGDSALSSFDMQLPVPEDRLFRYGVSWVSSSGAGARAMFRSFTREEVEGAYGYNFEFVASGEPIVVDGGDWLATSVATSAVDGDLLVAYGMYPTVSSEPRDGLYSSLTGTGIAVGSVRLPNHAELSIGELAYSQIAGGSNRQGWDENLYIDLAYSVVNVGGAPAEVWVSFYQGDARLASERVIVGLGESRYSVFLPLDPYLTAAREIRVVVDSSEEVSEDIESDNSKTAQLSKATGRTRPLSSVSGSGRVILTAIESDGSVSVSERLGSDQWDVTRINLESTRVLGDVRVWQRTDGAYLIVPTNHGVLVFRRVGRGEWQLVRTLEDESLGNREALSGFNTVFTDRDGTTWVVGPRHLQLSQSSWDRRLLAYAQSADGQWRQVRLDQVDSLQAMPAFVGGLASWVYSWNGLNVAGIDSDGDIWGMWRTAGSGWQLSNLSELTGAPRATGSLTVIHLPWDGVALVSTDPHGQLFAQWWAPGQKSWQTYNFTASVGGPFLRPESITSYVFPWGGQNVIGIDDEGVIQAYWWTPQSGGWQLVPLAAEAEVVGQVVASTSPGGRGEVSITARGAAGDIVHLNWWPGDPKWDVELLEV